MNWLVVLIPTFSLFFGSTFGRLEECYKCFGDSNSVCAAGHFDISDSNIFVADCTLIYDQSNTTEAVCLMMSGPSDIPKYNGSDVTYRLCAPQVVDDIEICELLLTNSSYAKSRYGFNVSRCTACSTEYCNDSPAHLGLVAAFFQNIFSLWH